MANTNIITDIITDNENKLPKFNWELAYFLDRTTVLYGASSSGKSTIIKQIMKILKPHIEQVIIVCPTEETTPSYAGIVDPVLIHYEMRKDIPNPKTKKENNVENSGIRFLNYIWDRQSALMATYKKANSIKAIDKLYKRLPDDAKREIRKYTELTNQKKNSYISAINHKYAFDDVTRKKKIEEMDESFLELLKKMRKKYIRDHYSQLIRISNLDEDEKYVLNYIDLNPRLLLILDDCAGDYKKVFKSEEMSKFFYRARHVRITMILSCQDDKDIPPPLRRNVFVNFYTQEQTALSCFNNTSNSYSKELQNQAKDISKTAFREKFRKLVFIRENQPGKQFFWAIAQHPLPPFKFGSQALLELCNIVRSNEDHIDESNPFFRHFDVN